MARSIVEKALDPPMDGGKNSVRVIFWVVEGGQGDYFTLKSLKASKFEGCFVLQSFLGQKKAPVLLKPFYVSLDLASTTLVARLQRSLLKTFQLPNFHPSTRGIFCCSQKVHVFLGILSPPFFGHPKHGSAESSIFEEPHILFFCHHKKRKKNGSAQQKPPPPNMSACTSLPTSQP